MLSSHVVYFCLFHKKVSNKPSMVRSISVTFAADKSKLNSNLLVNKVRNVRKVHCTYLQHHQIAGTPLESKLLGS